MTDEERAVREEARRIAVEQRKEEKRREREARSAANKAAWATDPRNVNYVRAEAKKKATAIPADPASGAGDSKALGRLRAIMADLEQPLSLRAKAAVTILQYELAPGALARGTGEPVASPAYLFLQRVAADPETPEALSIEASQCLAAYENLRPARVDGDRTAADRELYVALVNTERRRVLIAAGVWEQVVREGRECTLRVTDDFDPLELPDAGLRRSPTDGIGDMLNRAQAQPAAEREARREARRKVLRSIRARNRADDWQALLLEPQTV